MFNSYFGFQDASLRIMFCIIFFEIVGWYWFLRKALWHSLPSQIHINYVSSPCRQSIPPASQKRIGSILAGGSILGDGFFTTVPG